MTAEYLGPNDFGLSLIGEYNISHILPFIDIKEHLYQIQFGAIKGNNLKLYRKLYQKYSKNMTQLCLNISDIIYLSNNIQLLKWNEKYSVDSHVIKQCFPVNIVYMKYFMIHHMQECHIGKYLLNPMQYGNLFVIKMLKNKYPDKFEYNIRVSTEHLRLVKTYPKSYWNYGNKFLKDYRRLIKE